MKSTILNVINSNSGIKEVQLVMRVMQYIDPTQFNQDEFHNTLASLTKDGEIVAVHYEMPLALHSNKSMYFPKGTKFSIGL